MTPSEFVRFRDYLRRLVAIGLEAKASIDELEESQRREFFGASEQACGGCDRIGPTRGMLWHSETALGYCLKCSRAFDPRVSVTPIAVKVEEKPNRHKVEPNPPR